MSRPETTEDLEFNLFYQAIQVKRVSERERNSKAWTSPIVPAPLPPLPQTHTNTDKQRQTHTHAKLLERVAMHQSL